MVFAQKGDNTDRYSYPIKHHVAFTTGSDWKGLQSLMGLCWGNKPTRKETVFPAITGVPHSRKVLFFCVSVRTRE